MSKYINSEGSSIIKSQDYRHIKTKICRATWRTNHRIQKFWKGGSDTIVGAGGELLTMDIGFKKRVKYRSRDLRKALVGQFQKLIIAVIFAATTTLVTIYLTNRFGH